MPKIDFSQVDDVQDFTPVPPGQYLARLVGIEESSTQHGDEMWKLRFEIAEGKHAGRFLFDNMVFSAAAMKRVKLICSRLGLDVSKELELTPDLIRNRLVHVEVEVEPYEDDEGRPKQRNVIPFAGYQHAGEAHDSAATPDPEDSDESHLPF